MVRTACSSNAQNRPSGEATRSCAVTASSTVPASRSTTRSPEASWSGSRCRTARRLPASSRTWPTARARRAVAEPSSGMSIVPAARVTRSALPCRPSPGMGCTSASARPSWRRISRTCTAGTGPAVAGPERPLPCPPAGLASAASQTNVNARASHRGARLLRNDEGFCGTEAPPSVASGGRGVKQPRAATPSGSTFARLTSMITRRDLLLSVPASMAGTRLLLAQQPTFRVGAQNVPVYVTVTDANKRLVPGLEQADFEIIDDKTKAPITIFDNQIQPVTVAVMLDSSGSMTMNLELLKQAAEQFVIRLLPEDKGRIGYFNDKIAFLSDFSNDRDMLISSIKDMQFGNPTRLFDSVLFSLDELKNVEGRKVILEFTDGADTASRGGLGEVLRRAREEEVMIYGIGLQSVMMGMRTS